MRAGDARVHRCGLGTELPGVVSSRNDVILNPPEISVSVFDTLAADVPPTGDGARQRRHTARVHRHSYVDIPVAAVRRRGDVREPPPAQELINLAAQDTDLSGRERVALSAAPDMGHGMVHSQE